MLSQRIFGEHLITADSMDFSAMEKPDGCTDRLSPIFFCLTSHNRYEYDLFNEVEMSTT